MGDVKWVYRGTLSA